MDVNEILNKAVAEIRSGKREFALNDCSKLESKDVKKLKRNLRSMGYEPKVDTNVDTLQFKIRVVGNTLDRPLSELDYMLLQVIYNNVPKSVLEQGMSASLDYLEKFGLGTV